jgi:hypothetical protein
VIRRADAIRKGGNLGAHFDLEKEPNEETATLMIELKVVLGARGGCTFAFFVQMEAVSA